jgi:hypothetical protein
LYQGKTCEVACIAHFQANALGGILGVYELLVFAHLLAFVFWLGADLGVAILGSAFRDRSKPIATRLEILRLLAVVDMGPRTAWVAMVPLSITLVDVGLYWDVPTPIVVASWVIGAIWLVVTWAGHLAGPGATQSRLRNFELVLKLAITGFYGWLGLSAVLGWGPLLGNWLGWKALTFAGIFLVATMIDIASKPVGPLLMALIEKGSSDETEMPLRKAMDRARYWVWAAYVLLLVIGYLGNVKPF